MSTLEQQQIEGYALSPQQKRLFRDFVPGSPVPRNRCSVSIKGSLDPNRLRASLEALQERHEILRTGYEMIAGLSDPVQTIAATGRIIFDTADLESLVSAERELRIEQAWDEIAGHSATRTAEGTPEPLRAQLLKLDSEHHLLLFSLSILHSDGPTLPRLAAELSEIYAAGGEAGEVDEEALQYVQFAEWQNELLESEDSETALEFWRQRKLAERKPKPLPFQHAGNSAQRQMQIWIETLPSDLSSRLDALAEATELAPGTVLLTAWATLLGRLLGEEDLVLGLLVDGRKYEEVDAMPGPLAQALPVRAELAPSSSFSEALARLAQEAEEAIEWQEGWAGARGSSTPWRFGFEALDAVLQSKTEGGLSWHLERLDSQLERFDLELAARRLATGWTCDFRFDAASLAEASVRHLASAFLTVLAAALEAPESRLADLPILSEATREALIYDWSQAETRTDETHIGEIDTDETYTASTFTTAVHRQFENQAQSTPDATAVETSDAQGQVQRLSYRDLDTSANRLARS
ncbi:MAG: condensation domain-containing protein, partial [Acidobacteriota bacterium]